MEAGKETCIGFDVGKAAHRACAVSCKTGEILFNGAIENREGPIDEVLGLAGRGALVVVDQKRLSMKRARDMLPGVAKTDEIDAEVIARTAIGMPWTLRPVAAGDDESAEIRLLSSQGRFLTRCSTSSKNRLRSVLLEIDPAFEAAVDLGLASEPDRRQRLSGKASSPKLGSARPGSTIGFRKSG